MLKSKSSILLDSTFIPILVVSILNNLESIYSFPIFSKLLTGNAAKKLTGIFSTFWLLWMYSQLCGTLNSLLKIPSLIISSELDNCGLKKFSFFVNALENFLYARLSTLLSVNFWINLSDLFSATTVSLCSIAGNSTYPLLMLYNWSFCDKI